MKTLKVTHFFDVIKKEVAYDEDTGCDISSEIDGTNDVKQEYHYKEELDISWTGENDNFGNYGTNQENHDSSNDLSCKKDYPIVLIERLPHNPLKKYSAVDVNERTFGTSKPSRKSFWQHYRKFCSNCNKIASSTKNTSKCSNCDVQWNYECKKCNKKLPTYRGMINHLISKCIEKGQYYVCFKCNYKSVSKFKVNAHLKNVHSIRNSLNRIEKIESENVQNDVLSVAKLHRCKICGKQFQRLPPLLIHIQSCGQAKIRDINSTGNIISLQELCVHHCVKCNQTVKNDKIGSFHKKLCKKCNLKFSFKCKQCNKIFTSYTGINRHLQTNHTNKQDVFKCPECDYETFFIEHLARHVKRKHFVQIQECSRCGGKYKNRIALQNHLSYCQKLPEYQCDHCSYQSNNKMRLKIHIFQVHFTGNSIECPQCGVVLKNKACFEVHKKYCGKEPNHQCRECPFKTKYKYDLTTHYQSVHSTVQKTETCPRCAKQLKNASALRCHVSRCGKSAHLPCNFCSRLFKSKQMMKQHIQRLHAKDDNEVEAASNLCYLQCNDCTYKTKFKGDLSKHVIIHMEDNVKECSKCKKKLKNEYFKRHAAHCGKPLKCHICNFETSSKDSMRQHVRNVHSEKNEVDCPKCGRTCKHEIHLKAHLRRCGLKADIQCDHCSYKAKFKHNLKRHIEIMHLKKRRVGKA